MSFAVRQNGAPLFLQLVTPLVFASKASAKLAPAKRSVFILSTGRTGTVSLVNLASQVSGVLAVHEPKPSRILNAWTTAYLEGKVSDEFMAAALAAKRRNLQTASASIYVESNNFIAGFASSLDSVFENANVIHIVRDPRDFITSLTNRGDDDGIRKLFNKYVPYWAYVPKAVKKRQLTALTRAAYRWVAINEFLSDWGEQHPKNYYCFKFEDVFNRAKPEKLDPVLKAIGLTSAQIVDLDHSPKSPYKKARFSLIDRPIDASNSSSRQAMAQWRDWSDEDKRRVAKICSLLMRKYSYGSELEWIKALPKR